MKLHQVLRRSVAVLALTGAIASAPVAAQTVLKLSTWIPVQHVYHTDVIVPWAADVEKVTAGRVKVDILPKVVGSAPSQYDVVRDGLADVVTVVPGYTPGRFDVMGLGELPMASADPKFGSVAYYDFYEKHLAPLNLFKGVHVLSAFTTSPGQIFTTKKPIKRIADFSGMKLRSPVITTMDSLRLVGATPMQKPVPELYELLSGGVLDGTLAGIDQAKGFRLSDVTKHLTIIPGGFYSSVMVVMVNEAAWERISAADRKAIDAISGKAFAEKVGVVFSKGIAEGIADMKAKGGTVSDASPEFVAELTKALQPMEQSMFETAKKAGLKDPAAALSDLKAEIAQRSKAAGN